MKIGQTTLRTLTNRHDRVIDIALGAKLKDNAWVFDATLGLLVRVAEGCNIYHAKLEATVGVLYSWLWAHYSHVSAPIRRVHVGGARSRNISS